MSFGKLTVIMDFMETETETVKLPTVMRANETQDPERPGTDIGKV